MCGAHALQRPFWFGSIIMLKLKLKEGAGNCIAMDWLPLHDLVGCLFVCLGADCFS